MNLDYSNFTFYKCTFLDNIATYVTHGFSLSNSELTLINTTVNFTLDSFLNNNQYQVLAGFINMIYGSTINITSGTKLVNCRGSEAGLIYALTDSIVYITNDVLIANCISNIGPIINILETESVYID